MSPSDQPALIPPGLVVEAGRRPQSIRLPSDDLLCGLALVDRLRPRSDSERSRRFIDRVVLPLLMS
jgi:hypothetical protein